MPEPFFEFGGKPNDLVKIHGWWPTEETRLGILLERGRADGVYYIWRVSVGTQVLDIHQDALELCK